MRTVNILTGGSIVGLCGIAGVLLLPSSVNSAPFSEETPPERISLTGHIRDFPPASVHPDFQVNPSATPGAKSAMNVATSLDSDMKPQYVGPGRRVSQEWKHNNVEIAWCQYQYNQMAGDTSGGWTNGQNGNDNGGIQSSASFAQWFRDVPGVNMSRLWTINLQRQSDGSYVYDTNNFNPIDNQLFGNGVDEHNFYFTYEIVCTFTAAPGQYLEFKGDDDFWAFITGPNFVQAGKLMLDHGGIAANRRQRVDLDRYYDAEPTLGMQAGQEYKIHMFFAERCQPQSQFRLETNISSLKVAGDNSIFAAFD